MRQIPLLEAYIKHIQNVSDFDNFLKKFKNIKIMDIDEIEDGLLKYKSIPYDTAYVFTFPS